MADKMVVTAVSLQDLVDPKNPALLEQLGKTEGLAKLLRMWLASQRAKLHTRVWHMLVHVSHLSRLQFTSIHICSSIQPDSGQILPRAHLLCV